MSADNVRRPSRRQVLAGAAAFVGAAAGCPFSAANAAARPASGASLAAGPASAAAAASGGVSGAAASSTGAGWGHAAAQRGTDIAVTAGRSAEGRFGLMFKKLPAYTPPDDLLVALAAEMEDPRTPGTDPSIGDQFDNLAVPAGFTFLGQFMDHDLTRDNTPMPDQVTDPHGLVNFDSPRFDLQNVYGRGPAVDPQLYEPDGKTLRLVPSPDGVVDLPRAADDNPFIGDPRNDENHVVLQVHIAFMRLHNTFVAQGQSFEDARRLTRWHFQWIVVHDYLPHIVGPGVVERLLSTSKKSITYVGSLYKPKNPGKPMMPLEYAVAAFRFGHSMIRPEYEMHQGSVVPIFGTAGQDLRGSCPLRSDVEADWNYFFEIPDLEAADDRNMSRLMDTRLSLPLFHLPITVVAENPNGSPRMDSLAQRNLMRGKRLGLPSGQDVARAMGVTPLTNAELGLTDPRWGGLAPLWFYVLKEAEIQFGGAHLGTVGGRIVAETILGLLSTDKTSYLIAGPTWRPSPGDFRMGDLLRLAGAV
jgi:Animal haem peroxidase